MRRNLNALKHELVAEHDLLSAASPDGSAHVGALVRSCHSPTAGL
jgi:hypothetical protein